MKTFKRLIVPVLPGIAVLCFLACTLEPPQAVSGTVGSTSGAGGGGKTGWVIINIAAPGEAVASRTLLPTLGSVYYKYKLEFTRQGEIEPALTLNYITDVTLEQELDPGDYTLTVTAYKDDTSDAVAGGSVPVTVLTGEVSQVTVPLFLLKSGTGMLNYTVTLPVEITLTKGLLTLYPLSSVAASISIDLSAGLSGVETIPSGYYRIQLFIGGAGKSIAKTGVIHINDFYETTASYTLTSDDFTDTELFVVENSTQLGNALTTIRGASGRVFTILANASFYSAPISITDSGYTGKTITLRGIGDPREISFSSQGSLFTVGSASSAPVFILRDIVLKGNASNNAALLKVDSGSLIMESGAVVTGNTASSYNGSGVYVSSGTFIMNGGEISDNTASTTTSSYGGGVYVSSGTFTMNGGEISGNTTYSFWSDWNSCGGGVYVSSGTFTMSGGEISGNTSGTGGVCVSYSGIFTMDGGEINGNTSSDGGGVGVYSGTFTMNGGEINGNTSSDGGGVYVSSGTFTMSDGEISGNTASSDGGGVYVYSGTFTMNGGEINGNTAYYDGGGVGVYSGTFTMSDGEISGNTSSDGGGVSVSYSYSFGVVSSGTFTMNGGEISGNTASARGGGVKSSGTFTMNGGEISGNTSSDGGGVGVSYGTFTMSDGEISGNTASARGGGMYLNGGTFTKTGGVIYGSNETGIGSDGKVLKNTATTASSTETVGAAVYYEYDNSSKYRNTTVGPDQNLSTGSDANWSD
jgi:hypothetical protein